MMDKYTKMLRPTAKQLESEIVRDYTAGKSMVQIARDLNVNYHHVRNIVKDPQRTQS